MLFIEEDFIGVVFSLSTLFLELKTNSQRDAINSDLASYFWDVFEFWKMVTIVQSLFIYVLTTKKEQKMYYELKIRTISMES